MKNMKKMLPFLCVFLIGCSTDGIPEKLDGKYLKDENGNYYLVNHRFGDNVSLDSATLPNFK